MLWLWVFPVPLHRSPGPRCGGWAALGHGDQDKALVMGAWPTGDVVEQSLASVTKGRDFCRLGSPVGTDTSVYLLGPTHEFSVHHLMCFSRPLLSKGRGVPRRVRSAGEDAQAERGKPLACSHATGAKQSSY